MTEHQEFDSEGFELRRRLRGLSADRDPSRDLWPGIAQRLDRVATPAMLPSMARRRRSRWQTWTALAASVLGAAVLVSFWPDAIQGPTATDSPVAMRGAAAGSRALRIQAQAMTVEYQAALLEIDAGRMPVPLQAAAAELDRSASQIREAMRRDPQSSFLLERLRDVYAQRLRLSQRGLMS
ncbi:MAG: hypothetical protein KDI75_05500 [Xanthomonadales bacterium]|nr:hypothetical protein [Xanthomonadales bacterium]